MKTVHLIDQPTSDANAILISQLELIKSSICQVSGQTQQLLARNGKEFYFLPVLSM